MSSFDRPVKVDENGNIDTSMIERELSQALQFDVEYKQKDNMKKKAIKAAADYNEFKAMVDCAHLKTVTSKEVESLGKKKQGWQKSYVASTTGKAQILSTEEDERATNDKLADIAAESAEVPSEYVPASPTVMEKDMTSLSSLDEQVLYLKKVGLKRTKKVLKVDCSADLLEMLLRAILYSRTKNMEALKDEEGDSLPSLNTFKWIKAVSSFDRFRLTMAFVPGELLKEVISVVEAVVDEVKEEGRADASDLVMRFKSV